MVARTALGKDFDDVTLKKLFDDLDVRLSIRSRHGLGTVTAGFTTRASTPVPEPNTAALIALGLLGIGAVRSAAGFPDRLTRAGQSTSKQLSTAVRLPFTSRARISNLNASRQADEGRRNLHLGHRGRQVDAHLEPAIFELEHQLVLGDLDVAFSADLWM